MTFRNAAWLILMTFAGILSAALAYFAVAILSSVALQLDGKTTTRVAKK